MARREGHQQGVRTAQCLSAVAVFLALTVVSATPGFATNCDTLDHIVAQANDDGQSTGIENRIALPELAGLWDISRGQILNWFGVLALAGGCGQDCQMQVGNALGTIGGPSGPPQTTGGWRPYVELYSPYGSHFTIYYGLVPSASSFYNVYNTGIQDGNGFYLYNAYFNNAVGSGYVLIGQAWLQDPRPLVAAQAEMSNFGVYGVPCPYVSRQEFGTYGINTYTDAYSKVSLARPGWVPWEGVQTFFLQGSGSQAPYTRTYFVNNSAFGVNGS